MDKKNLKFSKLIYIVAVLCLATLFSAIFIMQNSRITIAEHFEQEAPITDDYIIEEDECANEELLQNSTSVLSETNSTDGILQYCLRDDYVIYTQDQDRNGLCWAFAGNMCATTTLMKATGQYYDFSEAWIALAHTYDNNGYVYGSGGTIISYNTVIKQHGLVLESDFQYENSYIICDQNKDAYFNHFSKYANLDITNNLRLQTYKQSSAITTEATKIQIKEHIYNFGSLLLSTYWNSNVEGASGGIATSSDSKYYFKCPKTKSGSSAHAVSIIGWDDNISFTYDGITYTGAWICLNSWGNSSSNDGVFYIAYNDTDVYGINGYSYEQTTEDLSFENKVSSVMVNDSEYTYTTDLKAKYYSNYMATSKQTQQKNVIICDGQTIENFEITYDYFLEDKTNNLDVEIDSISIYRGQEDVTLNFKQFISSTAETNPQFVLQASSSLTPGTYKILINYSSTDGTLTGSYLDVFYIMKGNESGKIICYVKSESNITNNGKYFIYNSYNYESCTINLATTKNSGTLYFWYLPATYSSGVSRAVNISFSGLSSTTPFKQLSTSNIASLNFIDIKINLYYVEDASNNILVNFYYYADGVGANNPSRLVVNKTDGVVLDKPAKTGYTFAGWYYDKECTEPLGKNGYNQYVYKDDKVISLINDTTEAGLSYQTPKLYAKSYYHDNLDGSCMAFVYASWEKDPPVLPEIDLTISKAEATVGELFTLSVGPVETFKSLISVGYSVGINWYNNGNIFARTDYLNDRKLDFLQLEQTINEVCDVSYSIIVWLTQNDTELHIESNTVNISIKERPVEPPSPVNNIYYSGGIFSWSLVADATGYMVVLYKNPQYPEVIKEYVIDGETSYSIDANDITSAGAYFIGVKAYKLDSSLNKISSEETTYQNVINFYEVSYTPYTQSPMAKKIIQEDTALYNEEPETKTGYSFIGWCLDIDRTIPFVEGGKVTSNIQLYADWSMNDILNIYSINDVEKEYDKQSTIISISPQHASKLDEFTYVWYYKQNSTSQPVLLTGKTSNSISILNVADSGIYFCKVGLIDEDGFSVTNQTNEIVVAISKAMLTINTDGMIKTYEYNGKEQTISSGALLLDKLNNKITDVEVEYLIEDMSYREGKNSFINVPDTGEFTLIVKVLGNDNYYANEVEVQITVKKAISTISVEKEYQFFRYTGQPISPEYFLNNNEQQVSLDNQPIYKGEYDVILTALASQNYEQSSTSVHITVNPANIYIKANDVTGVLFARQRELSYKIIDGEVYGNDDLGIELYCDVDTGKLGSYDISLTCSNENYKVAVFEGTYRVTAWPYYVGFFVLIFIIWIVISAVRRRRYQYEFETNGGDIVSPIDTKNKREITLDQPYKEGYKFAGWYTDMELTKQFKNNFKKSKGKTLYAKWEKIDGARSLTEELQTAQEIVDEIQSKINPKQEQNQIIREDVDTEQSNVKTFEEKVKDIVDSVKTDNAVAYSKEDLEKFINQITDKD